MTDEFVRKVVELASPIKPVEVPTTNDWVRCEAEMGLTLPEDYKELVTALGTGKFGSGLGLRNPCASSEYIRLSKAALLMYREPIEDLVISSGISLYPQPGGLVSIAGMDHQDFLLGPSGNRSTLDRLVWWDLDLEKVLEIKSSVPQFIHDLYFGRIEEGWADELRDYFWQGQATPFYTCWRTPS